MSSSLRSTTTTPPPKEPSDDDKDMGNLLKAATKILIQLAEPDKEEEDLMKIFAHNQKSREARQKERTEEAEQLMRRMEQHQKERTEEAEQQMRRMEQHEKERKEEAEQQKREFEIIAEREQSKLKKSMSLFATVRKIFDEYLAGSLTSGCNHSNAQR